MQSFATGFVISALNPINIFFWLTIYGSILSEHVVEGDTRFLWLNGCIVFTGVALWYFNVALTVHFGRRLLKPKLLRLLTFGAGLILIGYGIRCAILGTRQLMHWF
jgi:threonine/homoserine/homoserine lactone efflux protein